MHRAMSFLPLMIVCLVLSTMAQAVTPSSNELDAIQMQRSGLHHLLNYMDDTPEIFARNASDNVLLDRFEKQRAMDVWLLYLDYMTALSKLSDKTEDYLTMFGLERTDRKEAHTLALTAHYRFGLEFIARVKDDPELIKLYNNALPEQNQPKNLYRRFSNQMLSDWTTDLYDSMAFSRVSANSTQTTESIREDREAIDNLGRAGLLASNSAASMGRTLYGTYYPIQKGVARGMGKIKVWRIGKTLITPEQALDFSRSFEPGDFHLTRKEWRMTNVGIPGFWTHSAMYIGTPEERALYFNTPEVNAWVASQGANSFEDLLKQASPIYADHPGYDALGDIRVIEALDAGVIFNSIETSLDADGAAVFRPMVSKLEKAKAIHSAFFYTGQPYDFHFDFDSDSAMVCSELIVKAYLPSAEQDGVEFPINRAVGRKMLTPSELARWYDETVGTDQQKIELVMFIDSHEKDGVAFQSTKEAFKDSWKRPDWYIFQQPPRPEPQRLASEQPPASTGQTP